MASLPVETSITPEEYLQRERAAETKSEYHRGRIYAMSGATYDHVAIVGNISHALYNQLRGQGCRALTNDLRVRIPRSDLYTYPDVVVVCGQPEFEDGRRDTLLNPTLIVEVLSPSTESYDRGDKFAMYRTLESLRTYVLVSQRRPRVECFERQPSGLWLLAAESADLDGAVDLPTVGCRLALRDIYADVTFDDTLRPT